MIHGDGAGSSERRHSDERSAHGGASHSAAAAVLAAGAKVAIEEIIKLFPSEPPSRKPPVLPMFSFADTIRYLSKHHPGDPRIRGGALLRQPHPAGNLLVMVFLDQDDRICLDKYGRPHGRMMVAKSLDDELAIRFADSDLVIFR